MHRRTEDVEARQPPAGTAAPVSYPAPASLMLRCLQVVPSVDPPVQEDDPKKKPVRIFEIFTFHLGIFTAALQRSNLGRSNKTPGSKFFILTRLELSSLLQPHHARADAALRSPGRDYRGAAVRECPCFSESCGCSPLLCLRSAFCTSVPSQCALHAVCVPIKNGRCCVIDSLPAAGRMLPDRQEWQEWRRRRRRTVSVYIRRRRR